jgi:hypothetical protein
MEIERDAPARARHKPFRYSDYVKTDTTSRIRPMH